jgi:hypothetical protein
VRAESNGHDLKVRLLGAFACVDQKEMSAMRVLLRATFDTEKSNEAIRNGTMAKVIQESLEQIKPEAAYFTAQDGDRACFLVFDMEDSSRMPVFAEPFFLNFDAKIDYTPIMNVEDLQKGLSQLGR